VRKWLLGTAAIATLGMGQGMAADLGALPPAKAPPAMMAPIYNWTGFYIGGHVGGAWADDSLGGNGGRFAGGVQAGADYQFATNWVVGIEGHYSWLSSNNNGTAFPAVGTVIRDDRGLGSITGRLGWTWGPALFYAKGGYAFVDSKLGVTVAGVPVAFATTGNHKNGYTIGAGLEYMFAPNWSVKGEYQYYNFGNTTFVAPSPAGLAGTSFRNNEHEVNVGVNYRFGWGR